MATSMTDHPAAAPPPPKQSGGGGTILLLLVGVAAVGGGAWFLTHRGQAAPMIPPPSGSPGGPCPYSSPSDIMWHCVAGMPANNPTPADPLHQCLGMVAYATQQHIISDAQAAEGWLPDAHNVCWERLPTGCPS